MSHKLVKRISVLFSLLLGLVKYLNELVHDNTLLLTDVLMLGLTAFSTFGSYLEVRFGHFELRLVLIN